jgi:hypothetical protein
MKKVHQIYYYLSLIEQLGLVQHSNYLHLTLDERLKAGNFATIKHTSWCNPGATYGSAKGGSRDSLR